MTMASVTRKRVLEAAERAAEGDGGLALFLAEAIAAIDPDDLARQDPASLIAALKRTHRRLAEGLPDGTRIAAAPPETAGAPLVLDVISPDMPFILDSTLAA